MFRTLLVSFAFVLPAASFAQEVPVSADPRLEVRLFAASPDIVHPIAMDFDSKGRLLVVESHTHFRPAKYDGPKGDRIRILEDTNGDGKADKFTTFFEGTTATMDVAVHFDGSVYIATRNEILRLSDTNGDGKADEKTRIAFLETAGNYPHNGLAGLAFNFHGDLFFGLGENLGANYKLVGADGVTLTGGGEGGGIFTCTAEGKKLRKIATGFWNPFGAGFDIFGRLFVVDNDPDSSPPCRLVQIVEGGDYGFQFRYGRSGRHVFQSWNGELPGTLPYVAGTGESPCEVISYESDGLPSEYRGQLLVPAWADHRLERYVHRFDSEVLQVFRSNLSAAARTRFDRRPFIQGGKDFYPSGLSVAPDGSLFVSDWGSKSYELHGKGAVWQVRWKDAKPRERFDNLQDEFFWTGDRKTRERAARELVKSQNGREYLRGRLSPGSVSLQTAALSALQETDIDPEVFRPLGRRLQNSLVGAMAVEAMVRKGADVREFLAKKYDARVREAALAGRRENLGAGPYRALLTDPDAFLRHAAIQSQARSPNPPEDATAQERVSFVLAARLSDYRLPIRLKLLEKYLKDSDPDVRFLAIKWVSDEKLTQFRQQIADMLANPKLDPREFLALTTALARLEDKSVNDDGLADYFIGKLLDKSAPVAIRILALRSVNAAHPKLKTEQLTGLLTEDDLTLRIEALRALKDRGDAKAALAIDAIIRDKKQPTGVRAQAILTAASLGIIAPDVLSSLASNENADLAAEAKRSLPDRKLPASKRPAATDTEGWLKFLEGEFDLQAGRRIFENTKLTNCSSCHKVDGRGANVGPDLSLIGRTDTKWIVESILQPSAVVAPHFQNWRVETTDGKFFTGVLIRTYLDESEYLNEKGQRVKVLATDVADVTPLKTSIMPDGLLDRLTDKEIRDLVAYLASKR